MVAMNLNMDTVITMQGIFFVLWSISIYLFKRLINEMDERVKKNENEITEVKANYLDRFAKITEKQNESVIMILDKIHNSELRIINEIAKLKDNNA